MAQRQDSEVQEYRAAASSLKLQDIVIGPNGNTLLCDLSTGQARPIVPTSWRRQVFDLIHNLSHPSVRTTRKLVAAKFVWKGLKKQVGLWAQQCTDCQSSKVQTHVRAPLDKFAVPQRRFDHIHVDLVGPLPPSNGFTHLFTIIDRFSRWPEAIPINDTTAIGCAKTLVSHWISRFGVPLDISSDRGPQFTSRLWTAVAEFLGTQLHRTTAYHPQSNGLVERFHRHLKSSLRARLKGPDWTRELPWVLLGIRTAPKDDLGCSSAEMVYGSPLTVPGEFLPDHNNHSDATQHLQQLHDQVRTLVPVPTSQHGAPPVAVPCNLPNAKFVFIRRDAHRTPLQRPYEGPFKVIQPGAKTFQVNVKGKCETVSIDSLKPAYLGTDTALPGRQEIRPRTDNPIVPPSHPVPPPPRHTRSGRTIKLPQRYVVSVLGGSCVAAGNRIPH